MKDFVGFRFGNVHTKDLNLVVVTSSDRYEKNLLPNPKDYSTDIPGGNGAYYFGQTFDTREFKCDVAFDSVDEKTWRRISQLFSTDKLQDLVFDELPYKTYRAKLKSKPEFKFICFTDRDTGERVYKGEGTLNFICYFPYAFGFNKYIVRAADYYTKTPPEVIIKTHTKAEHEYANNLTEAKDKFTKDFYNVKNNMNTPWKGGYPTIEQVQAGELFFDTPNGKKSIIDVRGYWKNVPEWAPSSKLLTTPTLDYDQELIYLPQYTKTHYLNMDIGVKNNNALIGSRILVYNPGDLPVDFEVELNNNERTFWTGRGNHFQVRRFNVQRLPLHCAIDWTGLKTHLEEDNEPYKYGNRYFKIKSKGEQKDGVYLADYKLLNEKHPNHTYIAEPIPRELLGNFIRAFYKQSSEKLDNFGEPLLSFEEGLQIANRYEELRELCISEFEEYELYWKTLKEAILETYKDNKIFQRDYVVTALKLQNKNIYLYVKNGKLYFIDQLTSEINDSVYNDQIVFIDRAATLKKYELDVLDIETDKIEEKIYALKTTESGLDGERLIFQDITTGNYYRLYIESNKFHIETYTSTPNEISEDFDKFVYNFIHNPPEFIRKNSESSYGDLAFDKTLMPQWYTQDFLEITTDEIDKSELRLDTEKRSLYTEYYEQNSNIFARGGNYKTKKIIYNDNIKQGKWFKIPPGWSLIEITPVCELDNWGGKRWLDARPFDWGYGGDESKDKKNIQKYFDIIYDYVKQNYLLQLGCSEEEIETNGDSLINFRTWYSDKIETARKESDIFSYEYFRNKEVDLEYGFLKELQDVWALQADILKGRKGTIDEWWWYACNYIWGNFPPLYWGYADILNNANIKYTPLFY